VAKLKENKRRDICSSFEQSMEICKMIEREREREREREVEFSLRYGSYT
jgi:hypothetical protein